MKLRDLCKRIADDSSPWDALASLLLEEGSLLLSRAHETSQAMVNARMAVWQFVHFCRSPDGTGRWSTVKNLPQRIRDRIRLSEDRSLRLVPPEAEGLNAVRILTAHGSKGLEFGAVHFVDATARIFEPSGSDESRWLPQVVVAGEAAAHPALLSERHNLLYVVTSRAMSHLTVYTRDPLTLPTALQGLLDPLSNENPAPPSRLIPAAGPSARSTVVELDDYLRFIQCPHQYELGRQAVRSPRETLKLYRSLELAVRKAMETLTDQPDLLAETTWLDVMERELRRFGLHEHPTAEVIRVRANAILDNGRRFLSEGGELRRPLRMSIGPLTVDFRSDQAFESRDGLKLRLFRVKASSVAGLKQPLAALLDAHRSGGGVPVSIEIATLDDARLTRVGSIYPKTRERYLQLASQFCEARFPPAPLEIRNCMYCGYLFPCVGPDSR